MLGGREVSFTNSKEENVAIPANPKVHEPGHIARYTGLYRCTLKECEVTVDGIRGYPLPFADHHKHTEEQPPIKWEYIGLLATIAKA
jgi:hypothetical protein